MTYIEYLQSFINEIIVIFIVNIVAFLLEKSEKTPSFMTEMNWT